MPEGCRFVLPCGRTVGEPGGISGVDSFVFIDGVSESDAGKSDPVLYKEFLEREEDRKRNFNEHERQQEEERLFGGLSEEEVEQLKEKMRKEKEEKEEQARLLEEDRIQKQREQDTANFEALWVEISSYFDNIQASHQDECVGGSTKPSPVESRKPYDMQRDLNKLKSRGFIDEQRIQEADRLIDAIYAIRFQKYNRRTLKILEDHRNTLSKLLGKGEDTTDYRCRDSRPHSNALRFCPVGIFISNTLEEFDSRCRRPRTFCVTEEQIQIFNSLKEEIENLDNQDRFAVEMSHFRGVFAHLLDVKFGDYIEQNPYSKKDSLLESGKKRMANSFNKLRSILNDLDPSLESTQKKWNEFSLYAETVQEIFYPRSRYCFLY